MHDECKEWEKYFKHCKSRNRFTLKWRPCRKLYDNMNKCSKLNGNTSYLDAFDFTNPGTQGVRIAKENLKNLLAVAKEEYEADIS